MIMDSIERLPLYAELLPYARELTERYTARQAEGLPFEIRFKEYATKPDDARKFEVHQKTIDLMMCFEGSEVIHICPQSELTPGDLLPNGADGMKMVGAPQGTAILLQSGYFVAILPGEAHMVGGQITPGKAEAISKWVVKLPSPERFCI